MNKLYRKIVIILLATSIIYLPILPNKIVSAETKSTTSWLEIIKYLLVTKPPVKPRKGASRPVSTCIVSPNLVVWNTQPLFVWKSLVDKISLRQNDDPDFWNQDVKYQSSANYTGQPLQPGQAYNLIVDDQEVVPFQVMDAQKRNLITTDLQALETNLQAKGGSKEDIAKAKANYFEQHQLWTDALQEIYAVQNPSLELVKLRQEIPQQICSKINNSY